MKLAATLVLTAVGAASAFTATAPVAVTRSSLSMSDALADVTETEDAPAEIEEVAGPAYTCMSRAEILSSPNCLEFGNVWDPLGLAELGGDETTAWFRHAEVKHGRIAMAAFVGWCAVGAGLRLPGELTHGLGFDAIPSAGQEAWDFVPGWGKAQMLIFAGLIEFHDELFASRRGTHYMRGGTPGKVGAFVGV